MTAEPKKKNKVSNTAVKIRKPDVTSSKSTKSGVSSTRLKSETRSSLSRIRLRYRSGEIFVKESDLVAVSPVMRQRQIESRLPTSLDFRKVSSDAVVLLATYIATRKVKLEVSFYTLADVLTLSKTLMIEDLSNKLEDVLIDVATKSASNLLQALLVNDGCPVSREAEQKLHRLASLRFMDLVQLRDFAKLPAAQFLHVFASCELNVPHEIVAVDAALLWLVQQPKPSTLAPAVFYLVRTLSLAKSDRQMIIERCHILHFSESTIRAIRVCLDSPHSGRICPDQDHVSTHLIRCGVFDPKRHVHPEYGMPLSRPIRKNTSSRSLSKKTRSKKGLKSQKSTRPCSSKSHKSSDKRKH